MQALSGFSAWVVLVVVVKALHKLCDLFITIVLILRKLTNKRERNKCLKRKLFLLLKV